MVGDSVTWHNADVVSHQVVANDGSFASPVLKTGENYTFTFAKATKVTYHDSFATSHKGTVTVTAPAGNVSLTTSTPTVTYGDNTTVSGVVSNQLTSEPVTLTSQPYGKGTQSLASTTTQTNGAFSFGVSPTIQTAYQAHWRTANSPSVTDQRPPARRVRPQRQALRRQGDVRPHVRGPLRLGPAEGAARQLPQREADLPRRELACGLHARSCRRAAPSCASSSRTARPASATSPARAA